MFLPLPPSSIADLTSAHHADNSARRRRESFTSGAAGVPDSLQPDPIYMALRHLVVAGPLGNLVSRWHDWREAHDEREESRLAATQAVAAADRIVRNTPPSTIAVRDQIDRDLAA